jgi:hypothetical protein
MASFVAAPFEGELMRRGAHDYSDLRDAGLVLRELESRGKGAENPTFEPKLVLDDPTSIAVLSDDQAILLRTVSFGSASIIDDFFHGDGVLALKRRRSRLKIG